MNKLFLFIGLILSISSNAQEISTSSQVANDSNFYKLQVYENVGRIYYSRNKEMNNNLINYLNENSKTISYDSCSGIFEEKDTPENLVKNYFMAGCVGQKYFDILAEKYGIDFLKNNGKEIIREFMKTNKFNYAKKEAELITQSKN
jgi:hypothetical protein